MENPENFLIYNKALEEIIDRFKDELPEHRILARLPSFLEYHGPLMKKGKQGLVGLLNDTETQEKYVYKISQYLDFVIDQEYNVMKDLNTLRDFCPHFVKSLTKVRVPVTANYKKAKNPFRITEDYKSILTDMIVMQHLDGCKKFFKYIYRNKDETTTVELLSVVKQTLLAAEIARKKVKFTHYDLHSDNIMIGKCDPNSVFLYVIDGQYHLVPTYGMYPIIIDFGFSYTKSTDKAPMNCSLSHTKYGFIQCQEDTHADAKLFLLSVSYELKQNRGDEDSLIFRNIVKNLYKDARVQLDCGWDDHETSSINDTFLKEFDDEFTTTDFFDEHADYILDILQTMIILPLKFRPSREKTKDLLKLVMNEFSKIEKAVGDDFYHLYILKEIVVSVNANRDLYTNSQTRQKAVSNFKNDTLAAVDRIAKFCNPKLHWERLLCSLLCLGKNIENFCSDKMDRLNRIKTKNYNTIPLKTATDIYKAIEANIPSDFTFDRRTVVYTWNMDTENATKTPIDRRLIGILNETHPLERGDVYKHYSEHPELLDDIVVSSKESSRKESSKESSRKESSAKEASAKSKESNKQDSD